MSAQLIVNRVADDVLEIPVEDPGEAQAIAQALRDALDAEDIVAGLSSVCVHVPPDQVPATLSQLNHFSLGDMQPVGSETTIEIAISYGGDHGPDLVEVCRALKMTQSQFIALHTDHPHKVEMIGFTPGFAYISGLPDSISIPRLSDPRPRVPAGSVGISSAYTGIYALPGPGGWPLIGQTETPLFMPNSPSPFVLEPGQFVRFKAI